MNELDSPKLLTMLSSGFYSDIIKLLLDDEKMNDVYNQLHLISEGKITYTGSGVFIEFNTDEEIFQYRTQDKNLVLTGVEIAATEPEISAEANLFFKDGVINYLEIWSKTGSYPTLEPDKYTLKQNWIGSRNKEIKR